MTEKWNLIIDVAKCNGCHNCFLSAKDEYVENGEPGYHAPAERHGAPLIGIDIVERGSVPFTDATYVPRMCNHCDDPPCAKVAENGAVSKRRDGIVIIDPVRAKGQKQIADACPYGVAVWNAEEQVPQIWTFDAHLLDRGWKTPRCVQACATGAMRAVKITDATMRQMVQGEALEPLDSRFETGPRVWYRNLSRVNSHFIAGQVEHIVDGRHECADGLVVRLEQEGRVIAECVTDAYGEFKIDGIAHETGSFRLALGSHNIDVAMNDSINIGTIVVEH